MGEGGTSYMPFSRGLKSLCLRVRKKWIDLTSHKGTEVRRDEGIGKRMLVLHGGWHLKLMFRWVSSPKPPILFVTKNVCIQEAIILVVLAGFQDVILSDQREWRISALWENFFFSSRQERKGVLALGIFFS